ncbi:DUF917 domain-containing protein [Streptomyces radicis]|uniref:DUF917 domain-containing protein n=1 Tax=Streptomyces radicis TaxID=1750517 RepID=A0A3A9VTX9_9ACTN|nr:DUF917 domain-containing protein [Streptomyces radicis]RKN04229.1 DUF917 domain-containing protein [Streptomyces radicis]RKN14747.1 DUF917 domain-containing protein [Streptomyces radicis]
MTPTHAPLTRVDLEHLPDIARGSALLGTGGGGDPYIGRLLAARAIEEHGPVPVTALADVPDDALVVVVGGIGAPTVMVEKIPAVTEVTQAIDRLRPALPRPITHIACTEIGGVNSMLPIAAAARTGLPLVDADGMGRAFPELQMLTPSLMGVTACPLTVVDDKGNAMLLDAVDNLTAERLARAITVEMGCSATYTMYPMRGAQAREGLIPATLSAAHDLGRRMAAARAEHRDVVAEACAALAGLELFRGKVTAIERATVGGFARGRASMEGTGAHQGRRLDLEFQNEYVVARVEGRVAASVPDLVCVLDAETGTPVTTEGMRFGARVAVIGAPADPRWRTPEGLRLVGPASFGYDFPFRPVEELAPR